MKKIALITGGTRGIGLGIAKHLAAEGINLALNGMRPDNQVREVLEELKGDGIEVIYCQGNIALAEERKSILAKVFDHFGHLNILVNNAGMAPRERKDILEASEQSFEEVLSANLKGPYFLTQQVAAQMIADKQTNENLPAIIINISSISATVASVNRGEYCVSKAGLAMMTKLFATRLGEFDIPVFEIRPGIIHTDMTAGVQEKYNRLISEGLTIQSRWGMPDDVGKVVASLCRGDFGYSTGQVFMVDGGLTIERL